MPITRTVCLSGAVTTEPLTFALSCTTEPLTFALSFATEPLAFVTFVARAGHGITCTPYLVDPVTKAFRWYGQPGVNAKGVYLNGHGWPVHSPVVGLDLTLYTLFNYVALPGLVLN